MEPIDLNQELRLLPNPKDYYQGLQISQGFCPDNLLMFSRTSWLGLHKEAIIHPRHMLIVAVRGSGTLVVDGKGVELDAGCGLLVFPFQSHAYASLQEPLEWLFITFAAANDQVVRELRDRPFRLPGEALTELGQLVAGYRQRSGNLELACDLAMDLRRLLLASRQWLEPVPPAVDDQSYRLITEIKAFVDVRLHKGIRVKEVAAHFGISGSTLAAKFRRQFGSSLGQYLQRLRLNRAASLLVSGDSKIEEIARLSGFESSYAFGRAFRRSFQTTPSRYRRHYRALAGK
jgi:AraC-like DNA-binding protein